METLTEKYVEQFVRQYLKEKDWSLTNLPKSIGQHGADITAFHNKWRKILIIEAKGEGNSSKIATRHNGFYTVIGQIISRMSIQGNSTKKARIYAIAVPKEWESMIKNKIKNMKYVWKLLNLKVFLVNKNGTIEEKTASHFL